MNKPGTKKSARTCQHRSDCSDSLTLDLPAGSCILLLAPEKFAESKVDRHAEKKYVIKTIMMTGFCRKETKKNDSGKPKIFLILYIIIIFVSNPSHLSTYLRDRLHGTIFLKFY